MECTLEQGALGGWWAGLTSQWGVLDWHVSCPGTDRLVKCPSYFGMMPDSSQVKLGAAGRDGAPPLCRQTDLEPAGSCTLGTTQPLPKYNSFAQLSYGLTKGEDEDIP